MNLKYLSEQRSESQEQMQKILDTAKLEKRALNEKEIARWSELKKLITEIDATINAEEESRKMKMEENKKEKVEEKSSKETEDTGKEERAFVDFIITGEERAPITSSKAGRIITEIGFKKVAKTINKMVSESVKTREISKNVKSLQKN